MLHLPLTDLQPASALDYHQLSLKILRRSISLGQGEFSLILVHGDSLPLRQQAIAKLKETGRISELVLHPSVKSLLEPIAAISTKFESEALIVLGLESVRSLETVLASTNLVRNQFRQFPFPLILWVNTEVLRQLKRLAPDFSNWAGAPIQFNDKPKQV